MGPMDKKVYSIVNGLNVVLYRTNYQNSVSKECMNQMLYSMDQMEKIVFYMKTMDLVV